MAENFMPIPSLNNLYEISPQGVVRNAKTKHIIQPVINIKQNGKYTSKSVGNLLWEVYGRRRNDYYAKNIPVSIQKGNKKFYFESYSACARFLKKIEHYSEVTIRTYLGKRYEEIFGWKIKYFDEPKGK